MDQALISIVLPTYNGSRYIRKSIESCLNQSFKNFELIIINDCSTDNTASIIEEYAHADSRIKIIHNTYNKKLPLSLNTGFDVALGKYHTWTSDDNYYAPDALQKMLEKMEKNSNVDLVYTDYFLVDDNDKIFGARKFNNVYDGFVDWIGCGACFLYKKEIYIYNNGYNPAAFLIEDYDFFVRAFFNFRFQYLPTPELYFYREHPGSLTSAHKDTVNDLRKIMIESYIEKLAKKLPREQMALVYRKIAVYYAVQKNNSLKYKKQLTKLKELSFNQTAITILYVPAIKIWYTISVSFAGWYQFFKLIFYAKKNKN